MLTFKGSKLNNPEEKGNPLQSINKVWFKFTQKKNKKTTTLNYDVSIKKVN